MKQFRKIWVGGMLGLLFCSFFGFGIGDVKAQKKETACPTVLEVQQYFDRWYGESSGSFQDRVLQKRKDGFWIGSKDPETGEPIAMELFWSADTQKFLQLNQFTRSRKPRPQSGLYLWNGLRDLRFDYCKYYYYPGWAEDVIASTQSAELSSPKDLYGLGLAYSTHAMNLVSDKTGLGKPETLLKRKRGPQALAPAEFAIWQESQNKAIEYMHSAAKLNPNLQTLVGSVWTKYSNEVMSAWLTAWILQDELSADAFLRQDLYDPVLLEFARRTLIACPKQSILFSGGDVDTYPLLYLQQTQGLRTDVLIVNQGLLNWPDYAMAIRRNYGLYMALTDDEIAHNDSWYFLPSDPQTTELAFTDWVNAFRMRKTGDYFTLPSRKVWLPGKGGTAGFHWEVLPAPLLRGDWLSLDLIFGEAANRPICWTIGSNPLSYLDQMMRWVTIRGMVIELKMEPGVAEKPDVDFEAVKASLCSEASWNIGAQFRQADYSWLRMVIGMYVLAVQKAAEEGETEFALKAIELFRQNFSNGWVPNGKYGLELAKVWANLGQPEQAEKWLVEIAEDFENGRFAGHPNRELFTDQSLVLYHLRVLSEEMDFPELKKALPNKLIE